MHKIIYIVSLILLLLTGCSVTRVNRNEEVRAPYKQGDVSVLSKVAGNNITHSGYYIRRADIDITSPDGEERAVATVKCKGGTEYLISIRNRTGIEAVRLYISKDTVYVNDRINKVLYFGPPEAFERKYSIPLSVLPLIFGDYIDGVKRELIDTVCVGDILRFESAIGKLSVFYEIDCKKGKVVKAQIKGDSFEDGILIDYSGFVRKGGVIIAEKVIIKGLPGNLILKLEVKNAESPWNGELDFIPGSRYERKELR